MPQFMPAVTPRVQEMQNETTKASNGLVSRSRSRKEVVKWDHDAVQEGGMTSMACVIDWLTTGQNYARLAFYFFVKVARL
jgi:hypothetical protein